MDVFSERKFLLRLDQSFSINQKEKYNGYFCPIIHYTLHVFRSVTQDNHVLTLLPTLVSSRVLLTAKKGVTRCCTYGLPTRKS